MIVDVLVGVKMATQHHQMNTYVYTGMRSCSKGQVQQAFFHILIAVIRWLRVNIIIILVITYHTLTLTLRCCWCTWPLTQAGCLLLLPWQWLPPCLRARDDAFCVWLWGSLATDSTRPFAVPIQRRHFYQKRKPEPKDSSARQGWPFERQFATFQTENRLCFNCCRDLKRFFEFFYILSPDFWIILFKRQWLPSVRYTHTWLYMSCNATLSVDMFVTEQKVIMILYVFS